MNKGDAERTFDGSRLITFAEGAMVRIAVTEGFNEVGLSDGEEVIIMDGATVGLTVGFLEGARVGIFVDG